MPSAERTKYFSIKKYSDICLYLFSGQDGEEAVESGDNDEQPRGKNEPLREQVGTSSIF